MMSRSWLRVILAEKLRIWMRSSNIICASKHNTSWFHVLLKSLEQLKSSKAMAKNTSSSLFQNWTVLQVTFSASSRIWTLIRIVTEASSNSLSTRPKWRWSLTILLKVASKLVIPTRHLTPRLHIRLWTKTLRFAESKKAYTKCLLFELKIDTYRISFKNRL